MTQPAARSNVPTTRCFAAGRHGEGSIVHDPLTGQTYRTDSPLGPGRVRCTSAEVSTWDEVHPGEVQDGMPISVCWSPLVRCNLTCPQCLDDKTVSELPAAGRVRVAHVLAESPVLGVDISGGEPLLLRDLPELLDILGAGSNAVSVTTNGTHLPRRAEALADRVDALRVSLDGPDPARHDRWRGTGSFERAVAGIRAAVAYGIPTQIQTVLMRTTSTSAPSMVKLAAALGVHGVAFLQMLPIGDGAAMAATEQLSDDEAHEILAELDTTSDLPVRLRTREAAGGFTVIRADGQVWRNHPGGEKITTQRPLRGVHDLALNQRDGSA